MNGVIRTAAAVLWILVCLVQFPLPAAAQTPAWSSVDIGSPLLAGSASQSGSGFIVAGAGADVWGTRDEFHFMYQRVTGDFDLQTRVDSVVEAHWWSKAGVMVRNTLQADSPHGFVLVSAGSGTAFQRRRTAGGASAHSEGPFAGAPYWVKVSRRGSTVSAYVSANGSTWSLVGTDTIALGDTVYAGLAVNSHEVTARATATFSGLALHPVAVPSGMSNADVGSPAIPGSVQHAAGAYTITAAGADIWDRADQFHFVYQAVTGDFDVRGRVGSLQNTDTWAKAGVMIRESLAAGSRHALAAVTGGAGFAFQRRTATDGVSEHTDGAWAGASGWVRLVRQGASVEAFHSTDGTTWRTMGRIPIVLTDTVLVGMAVTSHDAGRTTVALMDRFAITAAGSTANRSPSIAITSPADGASFQAGASATVSAAATDPDGQVVRVEFLANGTSVGSDSTSPFSVQTTSLPAGKHVLTAQATDNAGATALSAPITITVTAPTSGLPAGLTSADIGAPVLAGSVTHAAGTFTVNAAGRDIWDTQDQFHFVYQAVSGDLDIRVRVGSLQTTDVWAKAGVMIRDSAAAGSAHASALVSAEAGYAFQRRGILNGDSVHTSGGTGTAPGWVRLTRAGSIIEAFRSADGVSWTSIGRDSVALGQTVLVGIAVTSHNESQSTVAVLDRLTVGTLSISSPPPPPASTPQGIAFTASSDHALLVSRYELEVFAAGATPGAATPVARLNLGKPAVSGGEITVDLSTFLAALAPGSYQATVSAVGTAGSARSAAVAFSK